LQISGNLIRLEGLDVHLDERHKGTSEVREGASAAIYDGASGDDYAAVVLNDLDRLLDASSASDHVFGDDESLAGSNGEAAQDEAAIAVFLDEDVALTEVAGDFLSDDDTSDGRRDDGGGVIGRKFIRKPAADLRGDGGVLQEQSALEKLPAMEAGTENEMTLEQCSGLSEEIEDLIHGKN